ncbi:uncharacterized protein LOC113503223 [Trichoplusia ni]|uniref:Uncharacterized protein LOC113503223 n=1 Tax=Trichoplusia ni TaxID=7111 RepID=A0A7E5WKR0_TRINI|nr:uncharacterized protein LOC113503223 [Trichoplusia ni]
MAAVGQRIVENKFTLATPLEYDCFEKFDSMFLKNEGIALFGSLEEFHNYPDGGQKATEVSRDMLLAAIAPFLRTDSTDDHAMLLSCIDEGINVSFRRLRNGNETAQFRASTYNMPSNVKTKETDTIVNGQPNYVSGGK